jgi:FixJ family two-component response regulator
MVTDATVFVVDDDPGVLKSMRWLLESEGFLVETYSSPSQFLSSYDPHCPGCLVSDLRMPEMDGLELQQRLAARGSHLPVIFVTGHGDVPKCAQAMKAGAVDFLEKPASDNDLLNLVHQALEMDRQRRRADARQPVIAARLHRLTPRERDVLRLLYEGKTNKAVAAELEVGFQTAAKHRARVLDKLQVQSEAELVRLLTDCGLAPADTTITPALPSLTDDMSGESDETTP